MTGKVVWDPRDLNPRDFDTAVLSQEWILTVFQTLDAGWIYQGNPDPAKPHAELASGKCSNGYFNCRRVLCYPNLNEILAIQLFNRLKGQVVPGAVVGSPYSAITFSYEVARAFGVPHFFAEKDPKDPEGKRMIWKEDIPGDTCVLQIEELITTLGTTQAVRQAIVDKNPAPVCISSIVGVCIHRPDPLIGFLADDVIVALVDKAIQNWDPKDCPYCKVGSQRVKPKANWALLVGRTA